MGENKVYYGRCAYGDILLQKMNLGVITKLVKLKTPIAVTKCNVDKGFSLYPRAGIFPGSGVCPGSVHPFESNSPEKKKGETWPKSFTFSSLEGHSDPPPLQVPNTITFRRTDCAALLNTQCFCGASLN